MLTFGVPALLVGVLAVVLIARGMPSFLQDNENLPLLQNFVITPAASDSEPSVRLARESLAPAVVQSGPGQSDESTGAGTVAAVAADSTPTPTAEAPNTASDAVQTATAAAAAVPPTVTPVATEPPVEEEPTATEAALADTVTPPPTPSPLPTETEAPTATLTPIPTATPTPAWLTYTIRAGDTIGAIARRFGISEEDLLRANDLSRLDVTRLQIGDVIVLPGLLQATPTPTATTVVTETPSATPSG